MKMVNLKQGTDTFETEGGKVETRVDYPWGLRITLNNETLKKLGIALPKVGDVLELVGKVKVLSTSTREDGEETTSNAELQITDIGLIAGNVEAAKSAADTLYGSES
ncbi:capsid staple protein [Yersinia enterocolitica]|uniref:capsid staple protein n=1 Tax=Yersinia enterocolitica TaxID=630 RepID=UPI00398D07BB